MTPGEAGYTAYAEHTDNKTFNGQDMPKWCDLPVRIQAAWEAAAGAIVAHHTQETSHD